MWFGSSVRVRVGAARVVEVVYDPVATSVDTMAATA